MEINEKLLSVIKAALGESDDKPMLIKEEVESLLNIARKQSILYMVLVGLDKLGYSELLSPDTKKSEVKAIYDYIQRKQALELVSQILTQERFRFVPLKGAVIRDLYPLPYMRTSSDVDVLVKEKDLENAINAIASHSSFRTIARTDHDAQLVNERVNLELHYSLRCNIVKMDNVLDRVWDFVVANDDNSCFLNPEFQVFYNVAHSAKHFIKEGGIGIRPMLDLWVLRKQSQFDDFEVKQLCSEAGILGYYETCCKLLSSWFEDAPYTQVTKQFEDLVFSGGVFGSEHTRIIARSRKKRGIRYVLSRTFRSSRDIKELYPRCRKYPILIPFYQVARWSHLLKHGNRKAASRELKQVKAIDESELKQYDELLKAMRL